MKLWIKTTAVFGAPAPTLANHREIFAKKRKSGFWSKAKPVGPVPAGIFVQSQRGSRPKAWARRKIWLTIRTQAADGNLCVPHHHRAGDAICRSGRRGTWGL